MAGTSLVIVESPAKAKTINKYLGDGYKVLASFGHVRDLPPKDGSVLPEQDFAMLWEVGDRAKRPLDEIVRAVKGADRVLLATDPDREGEAIAWHVKDYLRQKKLIEKIPVQRVTFNEITRSAVQQAMAQPRELDEPLIDAYMARRALDYLVGFNLSPVLWRKLPGSKSAGRVQSVALRLICEREAEIEAFRPQEYWTIGATFRTKDGAEFPARLVQLDGAKLDKFDIPDKAASDAAMAKLQGRDWSVVEIERRQVRRNPAPPFTTSTLQQEASRKLGFGATRTMRTAQALYEGKDIGGETVGLITYMRTDGVQLSQEAIGAVRALVGRDFGADYLPDQPRVYKTKAKNAQEAHEAIRPTDISRRPDTLRHLLKDDEYRLYELIWRRTVACQMASAVLDQVGADIQEPTRKHGFRATGSTIVFPGFLRVYREDRDDRSAAEDADENRQLPPLKDGQPLEPRAIDPEQHFTQPPPRFSEASLVKRLEELGIGRPSTYASILQVLQDREYVRLEKRRFEPEDRGRLVSTFLSLFFPRYVQYDFTADLEEKLDEISDGRIDWKAVLREFWRDFHAAIGEAQEHRLSDVITAIDEALGPHFFPDTGAGPETARKCPACGIGQLGLRLGKARPFIGCSNYPACQYTRSLAVAGEGSAELAAEAGPRILGEDPVSGLPVLLRHGPYGHYVQLGEAEAPPAPAPEPEPAEPELTASGKPKRKAKPKVPKAPKPKRASLPKNLSPADITLEQALHLLALPRDVGLHPEDKQPIVANLGRFGPFLKHGDMFCSLSADDDVYTIGLNRAVHLLAEKKAKLEAANRVLGNHPADGAPVTMSKGRFGSWVQHADRKANVPRGTAPETVTLDMAVEWLAKAPPGSATEDKPAAKGKAAAKGKTAKAPAAAKAKAPAKATAATAAKAKAPAKAKKVAAG